MEDYERGCGEWVRLRLEREEVRGFGRHRWGRVFRGGKRENWEALGGGGALEIGTGCI